MIGGTMGVGKTATCRELQRMLAPCVFLDGDWCWCAHPFQVTGETKLMVVDNIAHLLGNFLGCGAYKTVLFCWVMDREEIAQSILERLPALPHRLHRFTLTTTPEALAERLGEDIRQGLREPDILPRSLARLGNYREVRAETVDVSHITPTQAAAHIRDRIEK